MSEQTKDGRVTTAPDDAEFLRVADLVRDSDAPDVE